MAAADERLAAWPAAVVQLAEHPIGHWLTRQESYRHEDPSWVSRAVPLCPVAESTEALLENRLGRIRAGSG